MTYFATLRPLFGQIFPLFCVTEIRFCHLSCPSFLYERVFAIEIFSFVYLYLRLCIRTFVFLHRSAFVLGCVFVHRYVFVLTYTSARGQPHPYHSVPGWSSAVSRTPHSQHRPLFISNPFPAPLVLVILYFILLSRTPHICAIYPPVKTRPPTRLTTL